MRKIFVWIIWALALWVAGFALWVRIAPFDETRWHVDPISAVETKKGSFKDELVLPDVQSVDAALERVSRIASAWPRTEILFGSPSEGRVSYVTRTKLWRFPDVTTVSAVQTEQGVKLDFWARQRFGLDDGGVNRARIRAWKKRLLQN